MHRRLVWLTGTREETLREADAHARGCSEEDVLRIASDADRATLRAVLGREVRISIVDLHPGLDPDVLGAIHGTVRGGGLLVLCTPPLDAWPSEPSPLDARLAVWPHRPAEVAHRYLRRFIASPPTQGGRDPGERPSLEQQGAAVEAMVAGNVVVLTAHRGRGKSAALGIAARRIAEEVDRVIVTGPTREAVREVLRFAEGAPRVRFFDAEEAARTCTANDALFVDEAAALPLPLLDRIARRTERLAFATTVHGYEGTGRGFVLRFVDALRARHPALVRIHLEAPIRYAAGDPVEAFVHHALAIDAEPSAISDPGAAFAHARLDRDALAGDEPLLRAVFGLLVHAHYRTAPSDLWRLLDAPNLDVHVLRSGAEVAAAAVVAREGGLDGPLVHALADGTSRIRGHAIPESLVCHLGRPEAGALRAHRVTRIAVHPVLRRRGLGSRLLAEIVRRARASDVELAGSVFGATPELLRFWQRAGFTTVRLSASRSARSGEHSALVLAPLAPETAPLVDDLARAFAAALPHALSDTLRTLDPAIPQTVSLGSDPTETVSSGSDPEETLSRGMVGYVRGERVYDVVVAELWHMAVAALGSGALARISEPAARLVVMKVLQKRSWEEVAERAALGSVPVAMRAVRAAVAELAEAVRAPR